jgi:hypothetical protein
MTSESVSSWIGERIVMDHQIARWITVEESYAVAEFLGAGAEQTVFRITGNGPDQVIKVRKNFFAFTVNLLPDHMFPRFRNDPVYEDKLIKRLSALEGSPVLSVVSPLDELWTALAVLHLDGHDASEQELRLEDP